MKRKVSAYLTVYLALTLGVMLTLSLALIEGVRLSTLQLEATCISDIAMDAVMAEYHRELLRRFNILAVDSSYGTSVAGDAKIEGRLEHYLVKNTSGFGKEKLGKIGETFYHDFLEMEVTAVELAETSILTDEHGKVFRAKAVEALEDDLGLIEFQKVMDWLRTIEIYELDTRDMEEEKRSVDEKIASYQGKTVQNAEGKTRILDFENPTITIENRKKTGILWQTMGDVKLSGKVMNVSALVGQRIRDDRALQGNHELDQNGTLRELVERVAFSEYLMRYMGCFLEKKEGSALDYELEYVIAGKSADADNLKNVLYRILAMREAANAVYLFSDQEKCEEAETVAMALSALLMVPELEEVFQVAILLGWNYAESVYDVKMLLEGDRVPLVKNSDTWHYDLSSILEDSWGRIWKDNTQIPREGLNYQDYIRILLLLSNQEEMTLRAMDVVEGDIRQTKGNEAFRLDGCYVFLRSNMEVDSGFGYRIKCIQEKEY